MDSRKSVIRIAEYCKRYGSIRDRLFSGKPRGALAGEMHRGGLGKLAAVADAIYRRNSDEILQGMRIEGREK